MPDFTSSLYLGFRHPHCTLEPWASLTTGAPAALAEPARNQAVARALAGLQGLERGVLAPSTLHLFWDLFGVLAKGQTAIFFDAGVYPIVRWGIERAAARGVPVRQFNHHDAGALRALMSQHLRPGVRPLVVADGFCPACGRGAPLRDYLACAKTFGGLLIVDDTQALGVFGNSPAADAPYGRGGGGTLRWSDASGPGIIAVSSLAKGFGAPVAVLCGSGEFVGRFETQSETRVHCSPPSAAAVAAAASALTMNEAAGDATRRRLARLVAGFRNLLAGSGLQASGGMFPMQTLRPLPGVDAAALHERLLRQGIRTVLHKRRGTTVPLLSFIITARHTMSELETATAAVRQAIGRHSTAPAFIGSRRFAP